MRKSRCRAVIAAFFLLGLLQLPLPAGAVLHNLAAEWSGASYTENNWTVRSASTPASEPILWTDTNPNMSGWKYEPALPLVWFKSTADNPYCYGGGGNLDLLAGDIVTHGGYAGYTANVIWTSEVSGQATISGQLWLPRHIGRYMDWNLHLAGTLLAFGAVDVISTRAAPVTFNTGSLSLAMGDVVQLALFQGASTPDYVGVNLNIEVVPLPGAAVLLGSALLGLWGFRRRQA